ncbi:MAG: ASKHA domain-containing protein [Promethearchaeota archaeon]
MSKKLNSRIIIDFEPISRRIYLQEDKSFYEILTNLKIPIQTICGGSGTCGKCKILIQRGKEYLSPITDNEKKFLTPDELKNGWRLACQTKVKKSHIEKLKSQSSPQFRVFLSNELLIQDLKILVTGPKKRTEILPAVKKIYIEVKKPTLENPIPDYERVLTDLLAQNKNLKKDIQIDYKILQDLPDVLRYNDHKITLTILNSKNIIDCEFGDTTHDNFGIAFDIGTTTIVGYLINLINGKIYSVDSKLNSQTAYGEDVITRLTYIKNDKDKLKILNSILINDLNDIINNTSSEANISPSQIYEASIVGNSVMHHIFLGLDPVNIGLSPFIPVIKKGLNIKAKDLKLNISNKGNVYTAPLIAGFVGADTIGVILSSQIEKEKELTLAIDIGTNGEIIIGNQKSLAVGSCAAGSALEGAHISDGMRAAAGAIEHIKINPKNLDISYTTIKNKEPIGICGSGLVDVIAEMLKSKILTRSGTFNKQFLTHERFIKKDKNYEFILAKRNETSIGKEVTLTQNDIRQIQMAKAAFYSGSRIILQHLGGSLKIKQVFLAGAFGNYINAKNAKFIGMIPDINDEKIFQIGNAAGIGAQYCLLNKNLRDKAEQLLNKIQYIEIAVKKDFQKEYAEAMYFPHLKLNLFPSLKEYEVIPKR